MNYSNFVEEMEDMLDSELRHLDEIELEDMLDRLEEIEVASEVFEDAEQQEIIELASEVKYKINEELESREDCDDFYGDDF